MEVPGPTAIEFEHPIHLHGHHVFVLGQGKGNLVSLEKEKPLDTILDFENPPDERRETGCCRNNPCVGI